ncbi:TatD family hydrolase [Fervidicoccus fontis]|uniref:TatD family hydrolase n=1 Tax=Fervidicoccus fontis TaxID=683846 RepID=A0A843AGP9_9CREN|nr:TatD family hydrolase [Fervidicoccus fontis]MBE9390779.1 TatD family hydrolase [Fervidicoccus fontis]
MIKLTFSDAHSHCNPVRGMGAKRISEAFAREGGWFIAFIMLPSWDYGGEVLFDLEGYRKLVEIHSKDCREAKIPGLEVKCFAGFHPAEIDKLIESGKNPAEVLSYSLSIAEMLGKACSEGKIDGIGEVGRMHYKVQVHSALIAQRALEAFATVARDRDCPLQLHLEQIPGFTAESIEELIEKVGLKRDKVIIHHSTISVSKEARERGIWSTVLGKKELLSPLLEERGLELLLLESDFIDDPQRPGKVIYPWEIGRSLSSMVEEGKLSSNEAEKIAIDNVKEFFFQ